MLALPVDVLTAEEEPCKTTVAPLIGRPDLHGVVPAIRAIGAKEIVVTTQMKGDRDGGEGLVETQVAVLRSGGRREPWSWGGGLIGADRGFARFPGLRWKHPLDGA
jgi:hypothetical protein